MASNGKSGSQTNYQNTLTDYQILSYFSIFRFEKVKEENCRRGDGEAKCW